MPRFCSVDAPLFANVSLQVMSSTLNSVSFLFSRCISVCEHFFVSDVADSANFSPGADQIHYKMQSKGFWRFSRQQYYGSTHGSTTAVFILQRNSKFHTMTCGNSNVPEIKFPSSGNQISMLWKSNFQVPTNFWKFPRILRFLEI